MKHVNSELLLYTGVAIVMYALGCGKIWTSFPYSRTWENLELFLYIGAVGLEKIPSSSPTKNFELFLLGRPRDARKT